MGITYREHLIRKAYQYLGNSEPIPTDVFTEMLNEGLDVTAIEQAFHNTSGVDE